MTLETSLASADPTAVAKAAKRKGRTSPGRITRRYAVVTVIGLLALWWGVAAAGLVPPLFLPSPLSVLAQFSALAGDGFADATLLQHTGASLARILAALAVAVLTAVPVGLAMGLSPVARGIFDPIIEFYRPIPPLAYLPLIIIWFGIGEVSKVILIYLAMFATMAISTAAGVRTVPQDRINAARALGATRGQLVRFVILPNALPDILTGVRIGLGGGWSTLVAAELVAATRGLGFMVESAAQFLVTDVVMLGILVIAVIAFAIELALRALERHLVPWRGRE